MANSSCHTTYRPFIRSSLMSPEPKALVDLKGTINQQGFVLRKATEQALRRAQKTTSLLTSFQFRLVRALDLYTLAPFRGDARYVPGRESALGRYDYGYVAPDLLADYA